MTLPLYIHQGRDPDVTPNSGTRWLEEHDALLRQHFAKGTTITLIARELGRTCSAILARMVGDRMLIRTEQFGYRYMYHVNTDWFRKNNLKCPYNLDGTVNHCDALVPADPQPATKEATMSNDTNITIVTIETKTLINGVDGATLSDEQIFNRIAKIEAQIKAWAGIENKPKKLLAKIDEAKASIAALVSYVDGR